MESQEIIENINSIYERFGTPFHLQEHMKRAAASAKLICDHWTGEEINKENVVAMLLLHDLGNVVRFDFNNEDLNSLYQEKSNLEDLKRIQSETIEKYGNDDHEVTLKMCEEIGVNKIVLLLLKGHAFVNNKVICDSDDFESKICAYADQRIGPRGVMGLKERLDEAKARGSKSLQHPEADRLIECALEIEKKVLENTDLKAEDICDDSVAKNF